MLAIHEFHVWQLAGNRIIASAHIRCQNLRDYMVIAEQVKSFFHNEGIHSTTIQPEFVEVRGRRNRNFDEFFWATCFEEQPVTVTLPSLLSSSCCRRRRGRTPLFTQKWRPPAKGHACHDHVTHKRQSSLATCSSQACMAVGPRHWHSKLVCVLFRLPMKTDQNCLLQQTEHCN